MVVYRCAASAVSWILIRRKICGPDELYELGKIPLLSVDEGRALVLLLLLGGFMEGSANIPLDESAFLILATREGGRCIFPSRILFCWTSKSRTLINKFYEVFGLDAPCVGLASNTAYASKLNLEIFDSLFGARKAIEAGMSFVKLEKKAGNLDDLRGKSSSTSPSSSAIFITHPTAVNFSSEVFELISSSSSLGDHPTSQ